MNRIYKVIWSKVKNCYIVVSEIARSHSKPVSTKLNAGKTVAAVLAVAALCAGMTTSVMAADQYYSVNDMGGYLSQMGNKNNDGAQGIGSLAAGAGATVQSKSTVQGAMATVVGSLNTVATEAQPFDGVANSIVGVANATQNSNATLIFGAGNAVTNSYGNVTLNYGDINPADPVDTAKKLGAAVGDSGGQVLVIGGANSVDYARFSAVTGVSNTLNGADGNTSDYNFITGAKNKLTNADSTYVIGSSNTVSDGTSNVVIGDKRKLTSTTGDVVIGSADDEMETTVSDATILGHNANATVANGVALGSNSVASVAKGVVGTVPTGATVSDTDKASATWTSTLGAVSVGVPGTNAAATQTRQITGVAAGTQDTDAVNVAQLNAVNTLVSNNATSISNLTTTVNTNAPHFIQINQGTSGTNYNNDGAKGTNSIAIGKASTVGNDSIIIGQGAISKSGSTTSYPIRSGDIAIGMGVKVNNYVNQGGGIAIGYNARSENMAGQQERLLALGQTEYTTGIAIGRNSFARSGSTMVGTHNYSGAIGDVTINTAPESMLQPNLNPFATTVGANSFSSGTMSTVTGVYSIATSDYRGVGAREDPFGYLADVAKAPKNFGATITGSLNSIESATATSNRAGIANSIVGLANRAANANGALIFGAGNEITNSVTDITVPTASSVTSAKALQTRMISAIKASNSAGSTMAMGGGNKADYTQLTSIMGVNNTVTGTSDDISYYNYVSGFNNTATNTDNVTITGTNRTVSGANNTIVIGSVDDTIETTASDAVAVGRNSNVIVDGGVALGTSSVASVDKGAIGYDQSGKITDVPYDKEKYQSLQTQISETQNSISTLTSEATVLQSNLDQLKSWYPDSYEQMEAYQGNLAQLTAKQNEIAEAQATLATQKSELGAVLQTASTWQATAAAVSVGDVSKGITRQITGVAAGTQDTDAVNVAQLKAAKVEVVGSGDNVTVTSDNSEGYTKYTVAATDTKVTGLALANNTLTLSQNGLDDLKVEGIATTTDLANNKTHYFHVNSAANGTNYDNDGAKGANSIAIGQATTNASNSIVMGTGAKMNSYVNQPGGIAIGANSFVENMSGGLERTFDFGQAGYDKLPFIGTPYGAAKDPSRMTTGVAIGQNTYARSGAIMLGTHNYKGELGDVTVDSADSKSPNMTIFSTTLGANSYSNGLFSTLTGAYSIASSNYSGGTANATKNLGATINGAFNSIESATTDNESSGIGNSVVGLANRTANSNGALIFGAGNEITNSVTNISVPTLSAPDSAKGMQTLLMNSIKSSNSGGSTLAIGGGNKADYTQQSALIGVNNTLTGTSGNISQYNYLTGFKNTGTNVDNVTIIGTNRTVSDAANSVVIGSADSTMTSTASDAVTIGRNANTTIDGGVALGSSSVASVDKGVDGYNPSTKALTGTAWTSTLGSVSVGDAANDITRQITGVAAGKEDTDAVNVAQLKANKVTLEKGDNVTITADVADDGATTYTIASTDTNTVLAKGEITYSDNGADGTLVLIDSAGDKVTVTGLKNTYVESAALDTDTHTLTLNRNEGAPITVTGIATTADLAANKVKYFSVKSELAANQNNDGAKGTNSVAIGPNAVAQRENGIALGTNVYSGGKGSIVIGSDAKVLENIALEGSIVIGKGAEAFTGGGQQEALLGMDPTNWPGLGAGGYDNPKDASRVATSIVIGTNASGRTGSIDIGDRVYKGTMGGKQITDKNSSFHVNQTTLGTNTYNKGLFSTMVGSYSIATGGFTGDGGRNTFAYGAQNFGATVLGSLNSIRSNETVSEIFGVPIGSSYQGIANTIVGLGNITDNTNGSLVFGAGNKITNSITSISMPTTGADSVDAMVDKLQTTIKRSNSGGATLAIGGGNTADYTQASSIIGVNNTLKGTSSNISQYNALTGYNNTATNVDNVTVTGSNNKVTDTTTAVVIGDNRTLTGVNNNVVIGSADSALETTVSDAVAVGRNANVMIEGGVALGANSVARTDKGVVGYDPSGRITDADSILGSNTQYQSLQTEVNDAQTTVNDLTAKAAEYQANIDLIVSMYPDNSYEQDTGYQGIKASLESTQAQLATAQADLDSKQSALAEAGKALYTWQSTAGSVSVGDVSKGITRQITDVAAGTADTDAVNVAQLKANKVTVAAGNDNVTVTSTSADDGGTTYTVASKDTYTTKGTYDADSKKITFTQNDTEKNYEVDLSGLTDNIDKGLSFAGDSGDAINKQLGETMDIVGGATDVTTGSNIGVVSEDGKLNVRLAKDLTGLNSVAVGDAVKLGATGLTITDGPSVTTTGINAGNQKITNVAAGTDANDAVNVSQLNANKVTVVKGTNTTVDSAKADDGSMTYTVNAIDTKVTGGTATYDKSTGAGTITLTTTDAENPATVTGLQDTYVTNVALEGNTLTITQNAGKPFVVNNIATKDDVSGSATHYYSVNDGNYQTTNYDNKGAKGGMSLAAGAGSTANGTASTVTGSFSRVDGNGTNGMTSGFQGATAAAYGSFNVVGAKSGVEFDGVANSIIGVANKTENANAALIMGAGNKVTNSYRPVDMATAAPLANALQKAITTGDTDDMITALGGMVQTSGGAVLAIGGANTADYAMLSKVVGVGNTLTGTEGNDSQLNMIDGYLNTGTNVNNATIIGSGNTVTDTNKVIVIGDSRQLTGASNSVIIGSADQAMTTTVADATAIGHNANVTVSNGVALGSGSVASVNKDVAGYDVTTGKASTQTSAAWKSTAAAVSVGDASKEITRQITGVAAGMQDTDAVNVAQLKQVADAATEAGKTTLNFTGDDTSEGATIARSNGQTLNIIGGAKATDADGNSLLTDDNIGVVKDGDSTLKVQLAKNLTGLNSVAVGDAVTLGTTGLTITNGPSVIATGIDAGSKVITNVANGVNANDAVNVSQLNANKVTVAAGTNVTVTPTAANDGSTTYTVAAKDTYTKSGTYDANSKKITFVQNDTEKNYEVDVSGLVDGINENIDKGLNFAGDSGDAINKQLDQTLDIVGGAQGDLTTGNIGVVSEDGKLNVRLAKDLTGLNSVAVGDAVTLDTNGLTITNGPSVTTTGINAGSKVITNVANGVNPTDAVNVSQLTANKVTVEAGDNVTVTPATANDGSTTYTVASKDTYVDEVTFAGNTLTITRNDKEFFEVKNIATTDDISNQVGDVALNFAGDDATDKVTTKNKGTLNITGGAASDNLTDDNIGVVKSADDTLQVKLSKDLNALNSVRVGGSEEGKGIYIANQSVNNSKGAAEEGNYITGLTNKTWNPAANGFVSGRAATEDQLNSVYEKINQNIESSKAVSGKNITVDENNKVNLNDNITLGGDTAANQVNINGNDAKVTAGDGANKVVVDGTNGQVTIGEAGKDLVLGNQTVEGTKTDNGKDSQSGKFLTGLDNTKWDPATQGIVENRAATEGQLKNVADNISKQISDIDTAVKSTSRVFESDSGADAQVTRKSTDPMKLKGGADANNLSDNNIGVVNNSDKTGFDIKLSKDIKGLNSIEVNNKITIGTGDNQTIIEGDTINTGSVTTGNTTINNDGLTIVNEDSSKNITINNNNVNMGGNVIKNIGEGSEPTDAINKTQFDRAINNLGTGMNQINNRVNKLDNRVNRVGAGAAALAALHPLEFSPDAKWEVTAGVGNYRGANAIALGAFYRPNFDTMFSIGTSYGGGENMINAGVTWRIGEGETKAYPSKTVMAQEIDDLKNVVSEQQDQIEELKKLVNSLINK